MNNSVWPKKSAWAARKNGCLSNKNVTSWFEEEKKKKKRGEEKELLRHFSG